MSRSSSPAPGRAYRDLSALRDERRQRIRIGDVEGILRDISRSTQVLITTHSPILVNALQAHEVFVTRRDPKHGTRVMRIDRTPNYAERARVHSPGELWIAYADGDTEAALFGEQDT